jgi:acyl carrier protein
MTRIDIAKAFFEAINIVQQLNGESNVISDDNLIPRNNLEKFDSLCEINVIIELEELLKVEIKDKELFLDSDHQPLSINGVVDKLFISFNKKEEIDEKK